MKEVSERTHTYIIEQFAHKITQESFKNTSILRPHPRCTETEPLGVGPEGLVVCRAPQLVLYALSTQDPLTWGEFHCSSTKDYIQQIQGSTVGNSNKSGRKRTNKQIQQMCLDRR